MKKIGNKSVLLAVLDELQQEQRNENEKTASEIYEECIKAGHEVTIDSIRARLARMVINGKLKYRKALIDGRHTNLYYEA